MLEVMGIAKDVASYRVFATKYEHAFALKAFCKIAKCSSVAAFLGPSVYDVLYLIQWCTMCGLVLCIQALLKVARRHATSAFFADQQVPIVV